MLNSTGNREEIHCLSLGKKYIVCPLELFPLCVSVSLWFKFQICLARIRITIRSRELELLEHQAKQGRFAEFRGLRARASLIARASTASTKQGMQLIDGGDEPGLRVRVCRGHECRALSRKNLACCA